jgi:hypothetical protein
MPCHALHPIQDLFLESFSYVLQFDMHFYMHSYVDKNFILIKSGCYSYGVGYDWRNAPIDRDVVYAAGCGKAHGR